MESRYAIIENNIVTNIVLCSEKEAKENSWVPAEDVFIGDKYVNKTFVRQVNTNTFKDWETVREVRNTILSNTDWVVISSLEKNTPVSDEWKEYRQQLRDITTSFSSPGKVVFPEIPL